MSRSLVVCTLSQQVESGEESARNDKKVAQIYASSQEGKDPGCV